jgi:PIN domain nuclease of toxin-antitoxin system
MILLDTQTLLWAANGDRRLGRFASARIDSSEATYFASVSLFEIEIKRLLGKLAVPETFAETLEKNGFQELPFSGKSVAAVKEFSSLVTHDPFDRMILATAVDRGLTLLTSDSVLLALGHPLIVDSQV